MNEMNLIAKKLIPFLEAKKMQYENEGRPATLEQLLADLEKIA